MRCSKPRPAQPPSSDLLSPETWEALATQLALSPREAQIVQCVFDDLTESAIAARLGISRHTVHTHFERLHRKLRVVDRPQLILRVMQEFLLHLDSKLKLRGGGSVRDSARESGNLATANRPVRA